MFQYIKIFGAAARDSKAKYTRRDPVVRCYNYNPVMIRFHSKVPSS